MAKRRKRPRGVESRYVDRADLSITGEADYMVRRALAGEGRVVALGALVFFSTGTGDAWMLDPEERPALGGLLRRRRRQVAGQ